MAQQKRKKRSSINSVTQETKKNGKNDTPATTMNNATTNKITLTKMYLIWKDLEGRALEWQGSKQSKSVIKKIKGDTAVVTSPNGNPFFHIYRIAVGG